MDRSEQSEGKWRELWQERTQENTSTAPQLFQPPFWVFPPGLPIAAFLHSPLSAQLIPPDSWQVSQFSSQTTPTDPHASTLPHPPTPTPICSLLPAYRCLLLTGQISPQLTGSQDVFFDNWQEATFDSVIRSPAGFGVSACWQCGRGDGHSVGGCAEIPTEGRGQVVYGVNRLLWERGASKNRVWGEGLKYDGWRQIH